jgi:hypothetical protein
MLLCKRQIQLDRSPIRVHFPLACGREPNISLAAALGAGGLIGAAGGVGPESCKYDRLNAEASEFFETVDIDDAEVLIYPYRADGGPEIERVANEARKRGIGYVFISWGDADEPVEVSHGTVYRHSLFAGSRLPHEEATPAEVCDPQEELSRTIFPRDKVTRPSVGFCGFVSNPIVRTVYRLMGRTRKAEGLSLRAKVLGALRRERGVRTKFIVRQAYWAGARGRFHRNYRAEYGPRDDFWSNVINSDYTLCMRGAGNFSYRFYEVLAAGRIPLFINTRCVLPFEDEIDWRQHCVWVEEDQIEFAGEILKQFHSRLTPGQFRQRQLANRELWETKLSPLGFYRRAVERESARANVPLASQAWRIDRPQRLFAEAV